MLTTGSDQTGRHRDGGADVQEQGGAGELVFTLCLTVQSGLVFAFAEIFANYVKDSAQCYIARSRPLR